MAELTLSWLCSGQFTHVGSGRTLEFKEVNPHEARELATWFTAQGMATPIVPTNEYVLVWSYNYTSGPVFTAPSAGYITLVRVVMDTPLSDPSGTVRVGTIAAPSAMFPADYCDTSEVGAYECTPDFFLVEDDVVLFSVTPGTSTSGNGRLFLKFTPTS